MRKREILDEFVIIMLHNEQASTVLPRLNKIRLLAKI